MFDEERWSPKVRRSSRACWRRNRRRLTNISEKMAGKSSSSYKAMQRFLKKVDLKRLLLRFYQEDAEFVIGDPTEMVRCKAPKTSYVGTLSDGKTPGYWLMVLSTPFRGRSLPCSFVVYSSRTIGELICLPIHYRTSFSCRGEQKPSSPPPGMDRQESSDTTRKYLRHCILFSS